MAVDGCQAFSGSSSAPTTDATEPAENTAPALTLKKGLMSKSHWVQYDVEQKFLELDDFYPDAAVSFPPAVGVKT